MRETKITRTPLSSGDGRGMPYYKLPTMQGMFAPRQDGNVGVSAEWMKAVFRERKSIAVVGSSGNLLYRGHGPEIDNHGIIMRFNGAITKGYENDVGHDYDTGRRKGIIRTAWSVGYQEAKEKGVLARDELIVQGLENMWDDPFFSTDGRPTLRISAGWVRALHQDILQGAGNAPSTGFIGIAVAVALAQAVPSNGRNVVSVYGFGACPICGKYSDCVCSRLEHNPAQPTPAPPRAPSMTYLIPAHTTSTPHAPTTLPPPDPRFP